MSVIKFTKDGHIGVVALEEREHKNMFSPQFVTEIKKVFGEIDRDPHIKTVLVHGYDNYFCCGGTKEELVELYKGANQGAGDGGALFSELNFHDLLLRCKVPVVAAMQGHAIGGGLAFGSFADILVLGRQCIYSAIFMKYGFTPGMGATYIIPKKFGITLGTEMLFSGKNYYGAELKERGAPVNIVDREEVIPAAWEMAGELADKSVLSLRLLKAHLAGPMLGEVETAIEKEVEMHRLSFAQPEVKERIEMRFGN